MRPSVLCLLGASNFLILYPFPCCISSLALSLFSHLFLPDLSLSFLCAVFTASSFTPVCLFHVSLSLASPVQSQCESHAWALCCPRSLSAAIPHSFVLISFIHYASLKCFFYFSLIWYSNGGSAQVKLIRIADEPITHVRTCWGLSFFQQHCSGRNRQDVSPKLVITRLGWAINNLSVTFQFIFSLNSCSCLELKASIRLTVEGLRVTANHCDCFLFDEA